MSQLGFISRSRGVRGGNGTSGCDIFKRKLVFKRNEIFLGFVLLSFCINGGLGQSAEVVNDGNVKIEDRIKSFLNSHCNKQNQTLEQEEYVRMGFGSFIQFLSILRFVISEEIKYLFRKSLSVATPHKQP